jgi:hypothetical protein
MRISLLVLFLIVGCGPRSSTIPMLDGKVDDFEDGNRYNELGYEWESVSGGGEANATIFIEPGGRKPSVYQMTMGGMRPFGSSGDKVSGARVALGNPTGSNEIVVTDVTAYEGLELSMHGTPGSYIVQLGTASVKDFDFYNSYVEVTEEWNVFRIPFNRFAQEGFGKSEVWTGEDVTHIAIYSNIIGPYQLAVDNVTFYSSSELP